MKKQSLTFEESLRRLEEIVGRLESPEVPLQEGFALYQEGMKLARAMKGELNEIEKKVKILQKNDRGDFIESDFEPEAKTPDE